MAEWALGSLPALGGLLEGGRLWDRKPRNQSLALIPFSTAMAPLSSLVSEAGSFLESLTFRVNTPSLHGGAPFFPGSGLTMRLLAQQAWCQAVGYHGIPALRRRRGAAGWEGCAWGRHSSHPRQSQKICLTAASLKFLSVSPYLSAQGDSDDDRSLIKIFF